MRTIQNNDHKADLIFVPALFKKIEGFLQKKQNSSLFDKFVILNKRLI